MLTAVMYTNPSTERSKVAPGAMYMEARLTAGMLPDVYRAVAQEVNPIKVACKLSDQYIFPSPAVMPHSSTLDISFPRYRHEPLCTAFKSSLQSDTSFPGVSDISTISSHCSLRQHLGRSARLDFLSGPRRYCDCWKRTWALPFDTRKERR